MSNETEMAEQQVQRWSVGLDAIEGGSAEGAGAQLQQEIKPYIAVSQETGVGAEEVIERIKEKRDFDVVDRAVIEYLAERYGLSRDMLQIVDEKACHYLFEAVSIWLSQRTISQCEYMSLLARFVLMAAHSANTIFHGRGVQFILPREKGLAIRMVAPLDKRIERIMIERKLNRRDAKSYAVRRDTEKRHLIHQLYRKDITDPLQYDLVINTEKITLEEAAATIMRLWSEQFVGQPPETD